MMCNHYRAAIRKAGLEQEIYGFEEISQLPRDIYPDTFAPIIRPRLGGGLEWVAMRWGFPPPPNAPGGRPVTNVRNLASPFWRRWLAPEARCLVPFERFAEFAPLLPGDSRRREIWFEATQGQPAAFAGIWRPWNGERGPKRAPVTGDHLLFAFLTTAPNAIVAPYHDKAMPVILIGDDAQQAWLSAPVAAVPALASPLADEALQVVDFIKKTP